MPERLRGIRVVLVEDHDDSRELLAMPGEDGYWLIREVQTQVGALPAVAVTGFSDRYHSTQAHAAGFREYLNKPVDPDILCGIVAKVCDRVG